MTSKAQKLRSKRGSSKAGRPRKDNADRFPSGKIKPEWTEKEARSVVIEARTRVHGLQLASDIEKGGYTAGRMHLDGKITLEQLQAGNAFAERWARYQRLNGVPSPSARAQSFGQVRGHDGEESHDAATSARTATNRMMADHTTLLSCFDGPQVRQTVFNLFVMDCEQMRTMHVTQLRMLIRGLDALCRAEDLRKSTKQTTVFVRSEICEFLTV